MKKILLIATGGTIASTPTEQGLAPGLTSRELLETVPELQNVCEIDTLQLFNLDSTNMCHVQWLAIARTVREKYEEYFAPAEPEKKPTFGAPTEGSMPKGETGAVKGFADAWGFVPRKT